MRPSLVRPLSNAWQPVIDAVLRQQGFASTRDVARLSPSLVALSQRYNMAQAGHHVSDPVPLDARLAFSFARDVPKASAAVRELVAAGLLARAQGPQKRPVRIADLGGGLGAMSWGIARSLHFAQMRAMPPDASDESCPTVDALVVDSDKRVLEAASRLASEANRSFQGDEPKVALRTQCQSVRRGMDLPRSDIVMLGQVLSELDVDLEPQARLARHADLVDDLLARAVATDGSLVIVEPALRTRTRYLHALRDALVARGASIFAPCLHSMPCPMLANESDWCHDDLPIDLPQWVTPLARAAGLRWQGLTFSYLVIRPDGQSLGRTLMAHRDDEHALETRSSTRRYLRFVSDPIRTKGKVEFVGCSTEGALSRLRRLDRDRRSHDDHDGNDLPAGNLRGRPQAERWEYLQRGDIIALYTHHRDTNDGARPNRDHDALDERGRVHPNAYIDVWPHDR